ncbi:hypothetical protein LY78DRAFT_497198 [Colletotrichum sublineola]|nr:hypothetical protein LY78DRAFT_497198 [Colletotrichum sublineola]
MFTPVTDSRFTTSHLGMNYTERSGYVNERANAAMLPRQSHQSFSRFYGYVRSTPMHCEVSFRCGTYAADLGSLTGVTGVFTRSRATGSSLRQNVGEFIVLACHLLHGIVRSRYLSDTSKIMAFPERTAPSYLASAIIGQLT